MSTATVAKPQNNQIVTNNGASEIVAKPSTRPRITTQILKQVESLMSRGAITLPADYNVGNALNSAWLKLQTIQNRDSKPIIVKGELDNSVVTSTSVANALHDYVIQGLNCSKNQAYFIVYGQSLSCQRSYFGDMAVSERVRPEITFYFDTIRKGEEFLVGKEWVKSAGLISTVNRHVTGFPRDPEIIGAYCGIVDTRTGDNLGMTLMDIDRIRKSWNMSKLFSPSQQSPNGTGIHAKFTEEMALRTVVRHRCKSIINSSSDALLMESVHRQENDTIESDVSEDALENANRETLSLPEPKAIDVDPGTDEIQEDNEAKGAGF
jgi:recombination protein RecT